MSDHGTPCDLAPPLCVPPSLDDAGPLDTTEQALVRMFVRLIVQELREESAADQGIDGNEAEAR